MLAERSDVLVNGFVVLDAVHGFNGPHRGQLPDVVLRLIEKYDQATQQGYEAILRRDGGDGWPYVPPWSRF